MVARTWGAWGATCALALGSLPVAAPLSNAQAPPPARAASTVPTVAAPLAPASPRMINANLKPSDAPAPAAAAPATLGGFPTTAASGAPSYSPPAAAPAPTLFGVAPAGACGPQGCAPDCATPACDCLCGPPGRVWVSGEYLYWTARGQNLPPLVTAAPNGTPRATAGVLGQPGTQTLFGGQRYNDDWRSGFRLRAGVWLDECQRCGIEGDFFFLGRSRDQFTAGSDGSQIITRPFFNATENRQDAELVSFPNDSQLVSLPGVLAGSVSVDSRSSFIGGGINYIQNCCCDPCGRLDYFAGFRYLNLRDEVTITENLTALGGSNVAAGTRFLIRDNFQTSNNFYGGNIGLNYERRFGHFFLGVRPSVALGVVNSTVDINGSTTIIQPGGASQTYPGGLLTQPSNIGHYESDAFAVVPEIGVRLGVQVTPGLRAFVSYNYIYWSNVARAGDQIDLRVNTNQIAPSQGLGGGPALPAFQLKRTGYQVQGIGFGAEYRF